MATYVLIHGAGSDSWYWHLVTPGLRALGHDVVAVDLPCDDESAGLQESAETVADAAAQRRDVILVAQSLAGFTAAATVRPAPGGAAGLGGGDSAAIGRVRRGWWANTGHVFPDPFDPQVVFAHDLPPELAAESLLHVRDQSGTPFEQPWPLDGRTNPISPVS